MKPLLFKKIQKAVYALKLTPEAELLILNIVHRDVGLDMVNVHSALELSVTDDEISLQVGPRDMHFDRHTGRVLATGFAFYCNGA